MIDSPPGTAFGDWRALPVSLLAALAVNAGVLLLIDALVTRRQHVSAGLTAPVPITFITPKATTHLKLAATSGTDTAPGPAPGSSASMAPPRTAPREPPSRPTRSRPATPAPVKPPPQPRRRAHESQSATTKPAMTESPPRYEAPQRGTGRPLTPSPSRGTGTLASPPVTSGTPGSSSGVPGGRASGGPGGLGAGDGSGGHSGVVVLSRVLPSYPRKAEHEGVEGSVTVELMISTRGTVSQATVVAANPPGVFEQAALDAIRQWRFKPAYQGGRAVEQRARQRMSFRLPKR